ncbi:hypothetical protein SAMN02745830_01220 [Streptomyces sp. Amel2xC10]|nr:hypothetical protein SAMN02745830_01220 [Streptomyces sp. Amel2xC10]
MVPDRGQAPTGPARATGPTVPTGWLGRLVRPGDSVPGRMLGSSPGGTTWFRQGSATAPAGTRSWERRLSSGPRPPEAAAARRATRSPEAVPVPSGPRSPAGPREPREAAAGVREGLRALAGAREGPTGLTRPGRAHEARERPRDPYGGPTALVEGHGPGGAGLGPRGGRQAPAELVRASGIRDPGTPGLSEAGRSPAGTAVPRTDRTAPEPEGSGPDGPGPNGLGRRMVPTPEGTRSRTDSAAARPRTTRPRPERPVRSDRPTRTAAPHRTAPAVVDTAAVDTARP